MIELAPERIADAAGAEIVSRGPPGRPTRAVIDSREVRPGDLFAGLPGAREDGGRFASAALEAGAWGVLVDRDRAAATRAAGATGWILACDDPLAGLQSLATAWRRELGCPLVGITGSTGKTSVKDICRSILPGRVHASPENFNTEIGMPLAILDAPAETDLLVMEMAMRGRGQIAELCSIAEPDVGVITNVGPVHLELLGTVEAIAAAKAEILAGLGPRGRAVLPADAEALAPHVSDALDVLTFGPGGDVRASRVRTDGAGTSALITVPGAEATLTFPFTEAHNVVNALAAIAVGASLAIPLAEMGARTAGIEFSRLRGERVELHGEILLLNDCYNANPISMRAALANLAATPAAGRRLAILGGMAELGPAGAGYHAEIGALARELDIDAVIGVGELARDYAPDEWHPDPGAAAAALAGELREGDVALVKGSRSVGLERLTEALRARLGTASR